MTWGDIIGCGYLALCAATTICWALIGRGINRQCDEQSRRHNAERLGVGESIGFVQGHGLADKSLRERNNG